MTNLGNHVTMIAAGIVLLVLVAGLWNLGRKESSPSLSQRLMRWRVGLQFAAVVIAMIVLYVKR